jgi:NAD(P)-dependent dehydrogenase (short-subunit alcohol dehydrogenase family)
MFIEVATAIDDLAQLGGMPGEAAGEAGTPEQIAALVSYLVSKEAQYVTGKYRLLSYTTNFYLMDYENFVP